jgi:hypothetical protein
MRGPGGRGDATRVLLNVQEHVHGLSDCLESNRPTSAEHHGQNRGEYNLPHIAAELPLANRSCKKDGVGRKKQAEHGHANPREGSAKRREAGDSVEVVKRVRCVVSARRGVRRIWCFLPVRVAPVRRFV